MEYGGTIIHYYGDGCLSIFKSPIEAVSFAKILQEDIAQAAMVPGKSIYEYGSATERILSCTNLRVMQMSDHLISQDTNDNRLHWIIPEES